MWILALGGAGIVVGLATMGYKIMASIGVNLVRVTPSRGFTIEMGAAIVVLIGSRLGLPLSTTHCQVGSTVGVGLLEGKGYCCELFSSGCGFIGSQVLLVRLRGARLSDHQAS